MTEKDLINLGFTRKNSGASNDWHYYTYDIGSFSLISAASYEVKNDEWFIDVFESPEIRFTNPTEVSSLLTLITNNYTENMLKNTKPLTPKRNENTDARVVGMG